MSKRTALRTTLLPIVLAAAAFGAALPRPAPEFVFNMQDGPQQLLSAHKGKTIQAKGVQVLGALFDNGDTSRLREFRGRYATGFPVGVSDTRIVLEFPDHPLNEPCFVPDLVFIDKRFVIPRS